MTNLSLQDRFSLISLNALNSTRNSTAKKVAIRCISAASLRAELMEEGNVFDETVCMLWLLRESSCFYDLFSKEEQKYLTSRINELYLNSLLAKTLLSVSIHNALDSAALGLFSKKKAIFSTQLGTGVLFQVPFMERSSAVFIESEELYCNAEKRLESVIARLEENGNEVHVIRAGTVPLLQIDNLQDGLSIPAIKKLL